MKRSEAISKLQYHFDNNDIFDPATIGRDILKFVEKELNMVPTTTKRECFSGTAVIYKFEEDITEYDWDSAFDKIGRE